MCKCISSVIIIDSEKVNVCYVIDLSYSVTRKMHWFYKNIYHHLQILEISVCSFWSYIGSGVLTSCLDMRRLMKVGKITYHNLHIWYVNPTHWTRFIPAILQLSFVTTCTIAYKTILSVHRNCLFLWIFFA